EDKVSSANMTRSAIAMARFIRVIVPAACVCACVRPVQSSMSVAPVCVADAVLLQPFHRGRFHGHTPPGEVRREGSKSGAHPQRSAPECGRFGLRYRAKSRYLPQNCCRAPEPEMTTHRLRKVSCGSESSIFSFPGC